MKSSFIFVLLLLFAGVSNAYVLGSGKWGAPTPGTGAVITWSLMGTGTSCKTECTSDGSVGSFTAPSNFMPSGFKTQLERAFDAWSNVANLTFIEKTDNNEDFDTVPSSSDIRIGGHALDGIGSTLAHAFFPPPNRVSAAGDVHFDVAEHWKIGFGGSGVDIFQVFVHELGHALGLSHTNVPNSLMNSIYSESFSGPQADDIAGMQFLYGTAITEPAANPVPLPSSLFLLISGMISLRFFKSKIA